MDQLKVLLWLLLAPSLAGAQVTPTELDERRQFLLQSYPAGIVILTAKFDVKPDAQDGFRQDQSFYYYTGLENQIGAILLLDGVRGESTLFLPDRDAGIRRGPGVPIGESTAKALNVTRVVSIAEFVPFLDARIAAAPGATVLVGSPASRPAVPGLQHFAHPGPALREALSARWPDLSLGAIGGEILRFRLIKSPGEVEAIRHAGLAAAAAFMAGLHGIEPGRMQREVEVEAAAACYRSGADGVSWWPWVQTGPNAVFPNPFVARADYRHLNRRMEDGELARIDVGCEYDHYNSDVGRTAPVSGQWTAGQAEAWDLLIAGYRAGLERIGDGVSIDSVRAAFEEGVRREVASLQTELARESAAILLDWEQSPFWQIHGVGLEHGEPTGPVLRRGMVVAFEPMFTVRSFGFYLEDLLLITERGYELLTPGLPYTAREIEEAMRR
jgi:Xaa-Pro aminopeptidase